MYDYLIVGAGLFGATFANIATSRGKKCLVIDRRDHIAGNAYTERVAGITTHVYGPHIVHTNDFEVWEYLNTFSRFNRFTNAPIANYNGLILNLPFNMNTFWQLWGVSTPEEAKEVIDRQRVENSSPKNLEEQALSLVGKDIYNVLIKGYTEKQWGRPCTELPPEIIKRIPVRFTYDNSYFDDLYQGIPVDGYTSMVRKMLEGSDVLLGIDYLENRHTLEKPAKKIIYTGPIDEFFGYGLGPLEYRTLKFSRIVIDGVENYQGNAVVNFTAADVPYTRRIEHKHFTGQVSKNTVITTECPCTWSRGAEPFYPVNDEKNNRLYADYLELAKDCKNIVFAGRLGLYKYLDMDDAVRLAMRLAAAEIK